MWSCISDFEIEKVFKEINNEDINESFIGVFIMFEK